MPQSSLGGVGGDSVHTPPPKNNLDFHTRYEVETYTRDTPRHNMLIDDVITFVT